MIRMDNTVSVYDLLVGNHNFSDEEVASLFETAKNFVAGTARANRKRRIMSVSMNLVQVCGVLQRFYVGYFGSRNEEYACYTAGQDYSAELETLRTIFDPGN